MNARFLARLAGAVPLAALLWCLPAALAWAGPARVTAGPLWLRTEADDLWVPLQPGQDPGAVAWRRAEAVAAGWRYADGAEILLAPGGRAQVLVDEPDRAVLDLTTGTLWWRGAGPERAVLIAAGGAAISAGPGDELLAEAAPGGQVAVAVLAGSVRVASGEGEEFRTAVTVSAGQRLMVAQGEPPGEPEGYRVAAARRAYFPPGSRAFPTGPPDLLAAGAPPAAPLPPPAGAPLVALTFDDGPIPEVTPAILDTLRRLGLRATFFVVGRRVDKSPELLRRIVAEGHALANHTYDHRRLDRMSSAAVLDQVTRCQAAVDRALGHTYPMSMVRAPFGATNGYVNGLLRRQGYMMVGWDVDTLDWQSRRKDAIIRRAMRLVPARGGIVLLHDHVAALPELLPALVDNFLARGYVILREPARLLEAGQRLTSRHRNIKLAAK